MTATRQSVNFSSPGVRVGSWESDALRIVYGEGLLDLPSPEWLLEPFLPENGLTVLFGPPQAGKSLISFGWAVQLSHQTKFLGHDYSNGTPYNVLYMFSEGQTGIVPRLKALQANVFTERQRQRGVSNRLAVITHPVPLYVDTQLGLNPEQADLLAVVEENGVKLLVVDTLARNFRGDENKQQDMNSFINYLGLVQERGCAVLVNHHVPKGSDDEPRGSTALLGAADVAISLKPKFNADTDSLLSVEMRNSKSKDSDRFMRKTLVPNRVLVPLTGVDNRTGEPREYMREAVTLGPLGSPATESDVAGSVDYYTRFAEFFADHQPVKNKTYLVEAMRGKSRILSDRWVEFVERGLIVYSDDDDGFMWESEDDPPVL